MGGSPATAQHHRSRPACRRSHEHSRTAPGTSPPGRTRARRTRAADYTPRPAPRRAAGAPLRGRGPAGRRHRWWRGCTTSWRTPGDARRPSRRTSPRTSLPGAGTP
ncbi:hypothetical protein QJS66_18675 [Kocuria rhizophila]|nr:hypothetical protein QJS66_18675 [Kocuria rhizophila]